MKNLSKLLLASFMLLSFTAVHAQDENNPWALGAGINAVDFYPNGKGGAYLGDGYFSEFFNVRDHWNAVSSPISNVSIGRYLGGGFIFTLQGSLNRIGKFGDARVNNWSYFGLDGSFDYSFSDGWFDPFVGAGLGYTWLDGGKISTSDSGGGNGPSGPYGSQQKQQQQTPDSTSGYSGGGYKGGATANVTAGINFWFYDNLAFTLKTIYKYSFDYDKLPGHWQHVAGVKFVLGGGNTDGDVENQSIYP